MPYIPNEILLKIFSYLEEDTRCEPWTSNKTVSQAFPGITALSQLCLVSKRFNLLTIPLLYHSLPAQIEEPRHLLFRTLSQRPDLARHVKQISLRASTKPSQAVNDAWIAIRRGVYLPARLKNRITRALRLIVNDEVVYDDYPLIHTWTNGVSRDYEDVLVERYPQWQDEVAQDAELTVFLALVPDIEGLDLYMPFRYDLLLDTFRATISATYNFRKLRKITRETLRGYGIQPLDTIDMPITRQIPIPLSQVKQLHLAQWGRAYAIWMPYFRDGLFLPTLTELSCEMANFCGLTTRAPYLWPPAPRPLSSLPPPSVMPTPWSLTFCPRRLERIDLDNSNIDSTGLICLLSRVGGRIFPAEFALHTLRIRWGSGCVVSDNSILDFYDIGMILRASMWKGRFFLRTLDLDIRFALTTDDKIRRTRGQLGSLRELHGLEHLGVAYRMLVDTLDPSAANYEQPRPPLADILPTTLQSLHVTVFLDEVDTQVVYTELAELIRDQRFPGLREIRKVDTKRSRQAERRRPGLRWTNTGEGGIVLESNRTPSQR